MTVANENCIHKEIKSKLNVGNASYHSVQSFFYENLKIKTIITVKIP